MEHPLCIYVDRNWHLNKRPSENQNSDLAPEPCCRCDGPGRMLGCEEQTESSIKTLHFCAKSCSRAHCHIGRQTDKVLCGGCFTPKVIILISFLSCQTLEFPQRASNLCLLSFLFFCRKKEKSFVSFPIW